MVLVASKGQMDLKFAFIVVYTLFFFIYPPAVYSLVQMNQNPNIAFGTTSYNLKVNATQNITGTVGGSNQGQFLSTRPCGVSITDVGSFLCAISYAINLSNVQGGVGVLNFVFIVLGFIYFYIIIIDVAIPLATAIGSIIPF